MYMYIYIYIYSYINKRIDLFEWTQDFRANILERLSLHLTTLIAQQLSICVQILLLQLLP